jgi:hypothetical protein
MAAAVVSVEFSSKEVARLSRIVGNEAVVRDLGNIDQLSAAAIKRQLRGLEEVERKTSTIKGLGKQHEIRSEIGKLFAHRRIDETAARWRSMGVR